MRQKHRDTKNAASIIEAAVKQIEYTLTLASTDDSAFNIIRNVYECFRMLGGALLVAKGIESQDHLAPLRELLQLNVETSRPTKLLENLRTIRHNINYYGYTPKKVEADDALSWARACFQPLVEAVRQEIGKLPGAQRQ